MKQKSNSWNKESLVYSIRKLSIGTASVCLGLFITQNVNASELTESQSSFIESQNHLQTQPTSTAESSRELVEERELSTDGVREEKSDSFSQLATDTEGSSLMEEDTASLDVEQIKDVTKENPVSEGEKLPTIEVNNGLDIKEQEMSHTERSISDEIYHSDQEELTIDLIAEGERSILFNKNWKTSSQDNPNQASLQYDDSNWERIDLPHDYSIDKAFDTRYEAESGFLPGGVQWYRKSFIVPEKYKDKRLYLEFDGVYMDADVYLNQEHLGNHPYGYTSFAFDMTDGLVADGQTQNTIAVRVNNQLPSSRWYSGSGIYRDVRLTIVNPIHLDYQGIKLETPNLEAEKDDTVSLSIQATLQNQTDTQQDVRVLYKLYDASGKVVASSSQNQVLQTKIPTNLTHTLQVAQPNLWSVDSPYLYQLHTSIYQNDVLQDKQVTDYGFRYFAFDRDTGFSLNGENMKLKGVSMHHDQGALGAVANPVAIERQLDILKEMGVNAIRSTHNPAAQVLIDLANKKGFLVINEAFDGWSIYKNGNVHDYTKHFNQVIPEGNRIIGTKPGMTWAEYDLKAMIHGGKNAPSIIMWSIGNEITEGISGNASSYVDIAKNLIKWTKEVDETRPITIGDNRHHDRMMDQINQLITDAGGVVGKNYRNDRQMAEYRERHSDWILYGSETASAIHSRGVYNTFGRDNTALQLSAYDTDQARVGWGASASEAWRRVIENDWNAGEFIWTGFDYLGEPTPWNGIGSGSVSGQGAIPKSSYFGIIDTAGFPKDTYYLYRSLWNEQSDTLHLVPTSWNEDELAKQTNGTVKVDVFSNASRVVLYLNGKPIGEKTANEYTTDAGYHYWRFDNNKPYASFDVNWEPGELSVRAYDSLGREITEQAIGEKRVITHGPATQLSSRVHRTEAVADGRDLVYMEVSVLDADGHLVTNADVPIDFEVSSIGTIVGVDNGNPADSDSYKRHSRRAFNGKALVIVQTTQQAGELTITARSTGLESTTAHVTVSEVGEEGRFLESYRFSKYAIVPLGKSYDIPRTVVGLDNFGRKQTIDLIWDNEAILDVNTVGSYVLRGKLAGNNIPTELTVYVLDQAAALESYSTVTTTGVLPTLPATRKIYTESGESTIELPVSWDLADKDFSKAGLVKVIGHTNLFGKRLETLATIRVEALEAVHNIASQNFVDAPRLTNGYKNANGEMVDKGDVAISDSLANLTNGVTNNGSDTSERWTSWSLRHHNPPLETFVQLNWEKEYTIQNLKLWHFTDNVASRLPGEQNVRFEYWNEDTQAWVSPEFSNITQVPYLSGDTPYGFVEPISTNKLRVWLTPPQTGQVVGLTEIEVYNAVPPVQASSLAALKQLSIDGQAIQLEAIDNHTIVMEETDAPMISAVAKENGAITIVPKENGDYDLVVVSEDQTETVTYHIVFDNQQVASPLIVEEAVTYANALENEYQADHQWDKETIDAALQSADYLEKEYLVYPIPKKIYYGDTALRLDSRLQLVMPNDVDVYTQNRLKQVLQDQHISYQTVQKVDKEQVQVYLGIAGTNSLAEYHQSSSLHLKDVTHDKIDAYTLLVKDGAISVVGKDTDAVFYGLTTLKHLLAQSELPILREMEIEDYADIKNRGFIEGYYGNPWSNEDRASLMRFGGDLKLTQYFFAPKDDPYHNAKWRDLYPEEELEEIRYLAEVGNQSKTRYVWTLHPFMHQKMRFDEHYEEDLQVVKNKFTQLLDAGVREFGILADDAPTPEKGASSYIRFMSDLTDWLASKQADYQGLKKEMIFVPHEYWGNGREQEIRLLNAFLPETSTVTLTGGKIWGEVSQNFLRRLKRNLEITDYPYRPVQLWINWPCTDNAKKHLILGGEEAFLHKGVDPSLVGGIMLNPMQQAEPSKIAIFSAAQYAWTVWNTSEQAKAATDMAFHFAETGLFEESETSKAFRELGKHMINQNMDRRVVKLEESVELAPKLQHFLQLLHQNEEMTEVVSDLRHEFDVLKEAAELYQVAGNEAIREQIMPWLRNTVDQMTAIEHLLSGVEAVRQGQDHKVFEHYDKALKAYQQSKTHEFWYVDHYERAEFGVQHIRPFINQLLTYLADSVTQNLDPEQLRMTYISNREAPTGEIPSVFDGQLSTEIIYKDPNHIRVGDYVGVAFNHLTPAHRIQFEMGANSNLRDTFSAARLEYLSDNQEWLPLETTGITGSESQIILDSLDISARGIRLIATEEKENTWLGVREILINQNLPESKHSHQSITVSPTIVYKLNTSAALMQDQKEGTEAMLAKNATDASRDTLPEGAWVQLDLGTVKKIQDIFIKQGTGDKLDRGILEYSVDGEAWQTLSEVRGEQIVEVTTDVAARYVRLRNTQETNRWWRIADFFVETQEGTTDFTDANRSDLAHYLTEESAARYQLTLNPDVSLASGDYVGLDLKSIYELTEIDVTGTLAEDTTILYSVNKIEWYPLQQFKAGDLARYIRILHTGEESPLGLSSLSVQTKTLTPPSLADTTMGIHSTYGSSDVRNQHNFHQLFDGDLTTLVSFSDYPRQDGYIVIDLGEERNVHHLKAYIQDGTQNYLRDGIFQLSSDGQTWTDIITIGDGEKNAAKDDSLSDGWTHDSQHPGNRYIEGRLNEKVATKYIRILFTADYDHRFVALSELVLNDGEYTKTVHFPSVETDAKELRNHGPMNLVDRQILTSYQPGETSGRFTYHLSERTESNHIRLLTGIPEGGTVTVSARVIDTATIQPYTEQTDMSRMIELGQINSSLQTFRLPEGVQLLSVQLDWQDGQPEFYELVTFYQNITLADQFSPDYKMAIVTLGYTTIVSNEAEVGLPEGTQLAVDTSGLPEGISVDVIEDMIVVAATKTTKPVWKHGLPVTITYPDNSTSHFVLPIIVHQSTSGTGIYQNETGMVDVTDPTYEYTHGTSLVQDEYALGTGVYQNDSGMVEITDPTYEYTHGTSLVQDEYVLGTGVYQNETGMVEITNPTYEYTHGTSLVQDEYTLGTGIYQNDSGMVDITDPTYEYTHGTSFVQDDKMNGGIPDSTFSNLPKKETTFPVLAEVGEEQQTLEMTDSLSEKQAHSFYENPLNREGENRVHSQREKETSSSVSQKKDKEATLPSTGEESSPLFLTSAALAIVASVGLLEKKKKKER